MSVNLFNKYTNTVASPLVIRLTDQQKKDAAFHFSICKLVNNSFIVNNGGNGTCFLAAYLHCHGIVADYAVIKFVYEALCHRIESIVNSAQDKQACVYLNNTLDDLRNGRSINVEIYNFLDDIFSTKTIVITDIGSYFTTSNPLSSSYGFIYYTTGHYQAIITPHTMKLDDPFSCDIRDRDIRDYAEAYNKKVRDANKDSGFEHSLVTLALESDRSRPIEKNTQFKYKNFFYMTIPGSDVKFERFQVRHLIVNKILKENSFLHLNPITVETQTDPRPLFNKTDGKKDYEPSINRHRLDFITVVATIIWLCSFTGNDKIQKKIESFLGTTKILSDLSISSDSCGDALKTILEFFIIEKIDKMSNFSQINNIAWSYMDRLISPKQYIFSYNYSGHAAHKWMIITEIWAPVILQLFPDVILNDLASARHNILRDDFIKCVYRTATYRPVHIKRYKEVELKIDSCEGVGAVMKRKDAAEKNLPYAETGPGGDNNSNKVPPKDLMTKNSNKKKVKEQSGISKGNQQVIVPVKDIKFDIRRSDDKEKIVDHRLPGNKKTQLARSISNLKILIDRKTDKKLETVVLRSTADLSKPEEVSSILPVSLILPDDLSIDVSSSDNSDNDSDISSSDDLDESTDLNLKTRGVSLKSSDKSQCTVTSKMRSVDDQDNTITSASLISNNTLCDTTCSTEASSDEHKSPFSNDSASTNAQSVIPRIRRKRESKHYFFRKIRRALRFKNFNINSIKQVSSSIRACSADHIIRAGFLRRRFKRLSGSVELDYTLAQVYQGLISIREADMILTNISNQGLTTITEKDAFNSLSDRAKYILSDEDPVSVKLSIIFNAIRNALNYDSSSHIKGKNLHFDDSTESVLVIGKDVNIGTESNLISHLSEDVKNCLHKMTSDDIHECLKSHNDVLIKKMSILKHMSNSFQRTSNLLNDVIYKRISRYQKIMTYLNDGVFVRSEVAKNVMRILDINRPHPIPDVPPVIKLTVSLFLQDCQLSQLLDTTTDGKLKNISSFIDSTVSVADNSRKIESDPTKIINIIDKIYSNYRKVYCSRTGFLNSASPVEDTVTIPQISINLHKKRDIDFKTAQTYVNSLKTDPVYKTSVFPAPNPLSRLSSNQDTPVGWDQDDFCVMGNDLMGLSHPSSSNPFKQMIIKLCDNSSGMRDVALFKSACAYFSKSLVKKTSSNMSRILHDIVQDAIELLSGSYKLRKGNVIPEHKIDLNIEGTAVEICAKYSSKRSIANMYGQSGKEICIIDKYKFLTPKMSLLLLEFIYLSKQTESENNADFIMNLYQSQLDTCMRHRLKEDDSSYNTSPLLSKKLLSCVQDERAMKIAGDSVNKVLAERNMRNKNKFGERTGMTPEEMIDHVATRNQKIKRLLLSSNYNAGRDRFLKNNCRLSDKSVLMSSVINKFKTSIMKKSGPNIRGSYRMCNLPIDGASKLTDTKPESRIVVHSSSDKPKVNGVEIDVLDSVENDLFVAMLKSSHSGFTQLALASLPSSITSLPAYKNFSRAYAAGSDRRYNKEKIPMSICSMIIQSIFSCKLSMGQGSKTVHDMVKDESCRINYISERCSERNAEVLSKMLSDLSSSFNAEVTGALQHSQTHTGEPYNYITTLDHHRKETLGIFKNCSLCSGYLARTDNLKYSISECNRRLHSVRESKLSYDGEDKKDPNKLTPLFSDKEKVLPISQRKLYGQYYKGDLDIESSQEAVEDKDSPPRHCLSALDDGFPVTSSFLMSQSKIGTPTMEIDDDDLTSLIKKHNDKEDTISASDDGASQNNLIYLAQLDFINTDSSESDDSESENDQIRQAIIDGQDDTESHDDNTTEDAINQMAVSVADLVEKVSCNFSNMSSISMILSKSVSKSVLSDTMKKISLLQNLYNSVYAKQDDRSKDAIKQGSSESNKVSLSGNIRSTTRRTKKMKASSLREKYIDSYDVAKKKADDCGVNVDFSQTTKANSLHILRRSKHNIIHAAVISHLSKDKSLLFSSDPKVVDEFNWATDQESFVTPHIDPDYILMTMNLNNEASDKIISYLSTSRIFAELTIKKKISNLLSTNRNLINECVFTDSVFGLKVCIKRFGSPNKKDSGSYLVNYLDDNGLSLKMESWYYHDIIGYSTAANRLFMLICDVFTKSFSGDSNISRAKELGDDICDLYSSILSSNIWGPSLVFKVYRYYVQNFLAKSKALEKTLDSLIKSLSDDGINLKSNLSNKESIITFLKMLSSSDHVSGTPIFSLKPVELGHETCLINLCCPNTSGSKKHLARIMEETHEEIKMASSSFDSFKTQFEESVDLVSRVSIFEMSLKSVDRHKKKAFYDQLHADIDSFYDRFEDFCKSTDDRFSFNLLSLASLSKSIYSLSDSINEDLNSCPTLRSLCSVRSSFNQSTLGTSTASQNILNCANLYSAFSVALLSVRILLSHIQIDLSFKMFDKDQLGGDREISIMGGQFRMMQSLTEGCARSLGKTTGIDMLDNHKKNFHFCDMFSASLDSESLYFSADQTRWGPNFNTITFALMMLMMSKKNGQTFLPSLINFIGEFKIFETSYAPRAIKTQCTHMYSIPGFLGRFHMGQGIFHYNSSLYHSLVSMTVSDHLKYMVSVNNPGDILTVKSLITSDDAGMINCFEHPKIRLRSGLAELYKNFSSLEDHSKDIGVFKKEMSDYVKVEMLTSQLKNVNNLFNTEFFKEQSQAKSVFSAKEIEIDKFFNDLTISGDDSVGSFVDNLLSDFFQNRHKKASSRQIVNYLLNNYTKTYTRMYGIKSSAYKNVLSKKSVEFNTFYLFDTGIGDLSVKFLNSSMDGRTSGDYVTDLNASLNKYNDMRSSGVSDISSYICCLVSFKNFYDKWKVDVSNRYYPSKNVAQAGSVEYRFSSPLLSENKSTILKHKNLRESADRLLTFSDTCHELMEIRQDVFDTIRNQKTRSDTLMCHFVPSVQARLYTKSLYYGNTEFVYGKDELACNISMTGFPYQSRVRYTENVKVYNCHPMTYDVTPGSNGKPAFRFISFISQKRFGASKDSVIAGCFDKISDIDIYSSHHELNIYNLQNSVNQIIKVAGLTCKTYQYNQVCFAIEKFFQDEVINRGSAGCFRCVKSRETVTYLTRPNINLSHIGPSFNTLKKINTSKPNMTQRRLINFTDKQPVSLRLLDSVLDSDTLHEGAFRDVDDIIDSVMEFRGSHMTMRQSTSVSIPNIPMAITSEEHKLFLRKYRYMRSKDFIVKIKPSPDVKALSEEKHQAKGLELSSIDNNLITSSQNYSNGDDLSQHNPSESKTGYFKPHPTGFVGIDEDSDDLTDEAKYEICYLGIKMKCTNGQNIPISTLKRMYELFCGFNDLRLDLGDFRDEFMLNLIYYAGHNMTDNALENFCNKLPVILQDDFFEGVNSESLEKIIKRIVFSKMQGRDMIAKEKLLSRIGDSGEEEAASFKETENTDDLTESASDNEGDGDFDNLRNIFLNFVTDSISLEDCSDIYGEAIGNAVEATLFRCLGDGGSKETLGYDFEGYLLIFKDFVARFYRDIYEGSNSVSGSDKNTCSSESSVVNSLFCYKTNNMRDLAGSRSLLMIAYSLQSMLSSGHMVMISPSGDMYKNSNIQKNAGFETFNDIRLKDRLRKYVKRVVLKDYRVGRPSFISVEDHLENTVSHFSTLLYRSCLDLLRRNNIHYLKSDQKSDLSEMDSFFDYAYEHMKVSDVSLSKRPDVICVYPNVSDIENLNLCPEYDQFFYLNDDPTGDYVSVLNPNIDLICMVLLGMIPGADFIYDENLTGNGRDALHNLSKSSYYNLLDSNISSEMLTAHMINEDTVTFPSRYSTGTVMDICQSVIEGTFSIDDFLDDEN